MLRCSSIYCHVLLQGKLAEANTKIMEQLKEVHASNQKVSELHEQLSKFQSELQRVQAYTESEVKVVHMSWLCFWMSLGNSLHRDAAFALFLF